MYSEPGQDVCSVCRAGFYCGSNETSLVDMLTGAGSWDLASSSAGMCFNGTYCAAGMTRAPGDPTKIPNRTLGRSFEGNTLKTKSQCSGFTKGTIRKL